MSADTLASRDRPRVFIQTGEIQRETRRGLFWTISPTVPLRVQEPTVMSARHLPHNVAPHYPHYPPCDLKSRKPPRFFA